MKDFFEFRRVQTSGGVVLLLEGDLNARTACEVRRAMDAESSPVVLDVSRIRRFEDTAVPVLSFVMREHTVHMRGLGEHWRKMFRYFGVDAERASPSA